MCVSSVISMQQRTAILRNLSLFGLDSALARLLTACFSAVSKAYRHIAAAICTSFNLFQEMYSITEFEKNM